MKKSFIAGSALLAGGIASAQAAVPVNVSTALTDAATDAGTVAGLFLIAVIGIAAFKLMQRGAH